MILAALILQAAAPQTAVDAERAFAAAAQARGQWTAFRDYAEADAVMFVPQATKAQEWLKGRKDPAKSVEWWPVESWVSCDGNLAVNTGGSRWPSGAVGYFTTVWKRQPDGSWKWIVDHGDGLQAERPRPAEPKTTRAACLNAFNNLDSFADPKAAASDFRKSVDGSMMYDWQVMPDGARELSVQVWDGRRFATVIDDKIAAPAK